MSLFDRIAGTALAIAIGLSFAFLAITELAR